ncbi:hypothetical protein ACLOJK_020765 [Asimina triloba]
MVTGAFMASRVGGFSTRDDACGDRVVWVVTAYRSGQTVDDGHASCVGWCWVSDVELRQATYDFSPWANDGRGVTAKCDNGFSPTVMEEKVAIAKLLLPDGLLLPCRSICHAWFEHCRRRMKKTTSLIERDGCSPLKIHEYCQIFALSLLPDCG